MPIRGPNPTPIDKKASPLPSGSNLEENGSELTLGAKAQELGAVAAYQDQPSTSKRLLSFLSRIEGSLLLVFALAVLALSPLIFFRGIWITDTAVSYLAWPIKMMTEHQAALVTYQVVYSDGRVQKINIFSDEIERWISMSNRENTAKPYWIVRVIDPQGRVVWGN
jgi:hypothetical protein